MPSRYWPLLGAALWVSFLGAQTLPYDAALTRLHDPDPRVRIDTIRMLVAAGYPEAAVPVAALVLDQSNDVQRAAIDAELAVFVLDMAPARRQVALFIEVRGERSAARAFEQGPLGLRPLAVPPELPEQLGIATADDDPGVRWEALFALGTLGTTPVSASVEARLILLLADPDPQMRLAAALVAGRLRVAAAGEPLIYLLNDPEDRVQLAALEALGDLREARAAVALAERVEYYQRGPGAESALRAVARIGHPASRPLFESLAGARDANLRRFALEGLGRIGEADAIEVVDRAAATESSAEARLASQFARAALGQPGLDEVIAALGDRSLARQARDYLIELGAAHVGGLEAHLHDGDASVRAGVADVLGLFGNAMTLDRLDAVRADADPSVSEIAARAMERIQVRLTAG
jgi:HEAT repeat protein